jgi:hypothetical protein
MYFKQVARGQGSLTTSMILVPKLLPTSLTQNCTFQSVLYLLAVGSFAKAVCNALLIACQRFILLVSPENIIMSERKRS